MSSARRTSLAAHYLRYASSNLLVLAAGLVSFPVTTRLLSNAEFGVLSYWESALLFTVAVLKLGSGEAMMRYYPHGADERGHRRYAANLIGVSTLITFGSWLLLMLVVVALGLLGYLDAPLLALLAMAQALPAAWGAMGLRVLQAGERSALYSLVQVVWRWTVLAGTLGMLLYVLPTATGVMIGRLVANGVVIGVLMLWLARQVRFSRADFDMPYAMEALRFGVPVAMMELCYVSMWSIDRVMLKWLLDDFSAVGIYSIGMALASYVDQLVSTALNQAVGPVVNRVYTTEGADAVRALKLRLLRPIVYLGGALGAGLVVAGPDLLALLASKSKAASAPIFVAMGCVFLLRPILSTCSDGLLLQKRSRTVSSLTIGAAAASVLLNLVLIPRLGIMGAGATSALCMIGLQGALYAFCPPELRVLPPWRVVAGALALAVGTIALAHATDLFGLEHPLARLLAGSALTGLGCLLPPLLFDGQLRAVVLERLPGARRVLRAAS
jgi:O-antigen/teichoic acid export membrane protein